MKKFLTFIAIAFLTVTATAQTVNQLDEKNGFREFKFGMLKNEIPNLQKFEYRNGSLDYNYYDYKNNSYSNVKTDKKYITETEHYINNFDNLKLGLYDLKRIYYGFYKNRLEIIIISFKDVYNTEQTNDILELLSSQYGTPKRDTDYNYIWESENIKMKFNRMGVTIKSKMFDSEKLEEAKFNIKQEHEQRQRLIEKAKSEL